MHSSLNSYFFKQKSVERIIIKIPPQVKLQDIVFRSEGGQSGREAKSKITVYQDPSTHEYMGKLLSNKQVRTQVTAGENPQVGGKIQSVNQCSQLLVIFLLKKLNIISYFFLKKNLISNTMVFIYSIFCLIVH